MIYIFPFLPQTQTDVAISSPPSDQQTVNIGQIYTA